MNLRTLLLHAVAVLTLVGVGLFGADARAKDRIEASGLTNPPPAVALSSYDRFDLAELALAAPYAGQKVNDKARDALAVNLNGQVLPWVVEKNDLVARNDPPKSLRIEPRIDKIKTVGKAGRFWGGAFAGASRVLLKVKLIDAASGEVIAEPEFYQHASAMAGAYSMGSADQGMLERVAVLVADYLRENYDAAIGGRTGMPAK